MFRPVACCVCLLLIFCQVKLSAAELSADQLFARDHVLKVDVKIAEADWQSLCDQSRSNPFGDPSQKPFSFFKADVTIDGQVVRNVGIRKKGFIGSLDNFRPSLKIKFDKYQEQQPIAQMLTMTLNNNKQDRSLLSQSLTYQLFRKAGVHAPRTSLATVTVNGEYLGIYSHVESMKAPFLEREYGDSKGSFYEGTLADFYPKAVERLEAKNDRSAEDRSAVQQLAELLDDDGPLDLEKLETLLDIDNFLRFWAMESLIGFWDGYTQNQNNYFAYLSPENGKFYFMPWGADGCFGDNPFARFRGGNGAASIVANSILANRLFYTDGIPQRYKSTMEELLEEVWDEEEILAEGERLFSLVLDEFDEQQFFDAHDAKDRLFEFIKGRRAKIKAELDGDWPPSVASEPRIPFHFEEVGSAAGSFSVAWNSTDAANVARVRMELNGSKQQFESVAVTAQKSEGRGFGFGRFGRPDPDPPISIILTANREDGEPITLTINVKREELVSQKEKKLAVTGSLRDANQRDSGRRSPWGRGGPQLQGTVTVKSVSAKDGELLKGELIAGEFELKIVEMRGGFGR